MTIPKSTSESRKILSVFNWSSLLLSIIPFITLLFTNHLETVSFSHCVNGIALITILLFGPDFLVKRSQNLQLKSVEIWTVILLLALAIIGPLTSKYTNHGYSILLLIGIASRLLSRPIKPIVTKPNWAGTTFIVFLCFFTYFSLYGKGYHKWFFTESAAIGGGIIDTYFHAAIAESIHQMGVVSTSIDGTPYFQYHWFSHWLLGGLSQGIGINSFAFYNLFYPALFVPLGLKMFYCSYRQFSKLGLLGHRENPIAFAVSLILFYSLPIIPSVNIQPFIGESQCIAWIFVTGHIALLINTLQVKKTNNKQTTLIILTSFAFGLLISFTKISTGFVWLGALSILFVARVPKRMWIWSIPLFLTIPLLILKYILILDRNVASTSLIERVNNLFGKSDQFFFLFWVPILLVISRHVIKWPRWKLSISSLQNSRDTNLLSLILLIGVWVLGWVGAIAASSWRPDVMYFVLPGLLLSLPIWTELIDKLIRSYTPRVQIISATIVISAIVFSTPRIFGGLVLAQQEYTAVTNIEENSLQRIAFIKLLNQIRSKNDKNILIAISSEESWFWDAQPHKLATSFLIPAISGVPMVAGVPKDILNSDYQYYSVADYKKTPHPPVVQPENLANQLPESVANRQLIKIYWNGNEMIAEKIQQRNR